VAFKETGTTINIVKSVKMSYMGDSQLLNTLISFKKVINP